MGDFNGLVRLNLLGKSLKGLEPAANFRGQPPYTVPTSHFEIGGDNPCSRHLSERLRLAGYFRYLECAFSHSAKASNETCSVPRHRSVAGHYSETLRR